MPSHKTRDYSGLCVSYPRSISAATKKDAALLAQQELEAIVTAHEEQTKLIHCTHNNISFILMIETKAASINTTIIDMRDHKGGHYRETCSYARNKTSHDSLRYNLVMNLIHRVFSRDMIIGSSPKNVRDNLLDYARAFFSQYDGRSQQQTGNNDCIPDAFADDLLRYLEYQENYAL